jgi:predicted aldo/keto reductase-like oxidoreductase
MSKTSRRGFLKSGLACAAAAAVPSCAGKETGRIEKKPKFPIVTRTLGRTGINIPLISMGAVSWDESLYYAAMESGIVFIDTDQMYRRGKHERFIGRILKRRPREEMVVSTRINIDKKRNGLYPEGTTGESFLKPFEKSLANLGVDYLDIISLHAAMSVREATHPAPLDFLRKVKSEGRAKFAGVSIHGYEPDIIRAVADCGVYDVFFISYNYKQRHRDEIREAIAYAAKAGLGVIAMKTQAGAFLDRERKIPVNHRAAIKWVLKDTNVHTVIPGFNNIEQMEMYLSVMSDLELTPGEEADLTAAFGHEGLYCQMCGRCRFTCRQRMDIPSMMRAYMYAYGYRDPARAKSAMRHIAPGGIRCGDCSSCTASCEMGFDIRGRVLDIARVRDIPDDFLEV